MNGELRSAPTGALHRLAADRGAREQLSTLKVDTGKDERSRSEQADVLLMHGTPMPFSLSRLKVGVGNEQPDFLLTQGAADAGHFQR